MKATIKIEVRNRSQECKDWADIYSMAITVWIAKNAMLLSHAQIIGKDGANITGTQIDCLGDNLFKLKSEVGVHRFIRISPYDPLKKRHTSFITVSVNLDGIDVGNEIKNKDRKKIIKWNNCIRSYILDPYKLVKDHRTGYSESDVNSVFAGNFDGFMDAFLNMP